MSYGLLECLTAFREIEGIPKCKKYVTRLRARAGPILPDNVASLGNPDARQIEWAKALRDHCRACALCEMAER